MFEENRASMEKMDIPRPVTLVEKVDTNIDASDTAHCSSKNQ
jgi:hypothetical protein